MMTREMMEEIFEGVCRDHDLAWYEVFDGDLFDTVCEIIADRMGLAHGAEDDLYDLLCEASADFCEWTSEMGGDL